MDVLTGECGRVYSVRAVFGAGNVASAGAVVRGASGVACARVHAAGGSRHGQGQPGGLVV